MSAGGWTGRLAEPAALPDWLAADDLDYYVEQFERSGFRGPINYYRNFDRNWELTPQLAAAPVTQRGPKTLRARRSGRGRSGSPEGSRRSRQT